MTEALPAFLDATFAPWTPDPARPNKVAVLMSGGVDSSATARMLLNRGWDAFGVTMRIPQTCGNARPCCGFEAAAVCRDLGIPHYFLDTAEAFGRRVIAPFRTAYARGETPNPCVACNAALKFDVVMDAVETAFAVATVATGHYARIAADGNGGFRLLRAVDAGRDQSYFLFGIRRERLGRILFPLGDRTKEDVRAFSRAEGVRVADRPASMDLCFAGEGDYRTALAGAGGRPGAIRDTGGRVLGRHGGIGGFTPGQRRGIGVSAPQPLYVLAVDAATDTVIVGKREEGLRAEVAAGGVNVLDPRAYRTGARLFGRIRSSGAPQPCEVLRAGEILTVRFEAPVFAPAPGQHLVLYDAEGAVIAGGAILQT